MSEPARLFDPDEGRPQPKPAVLRPEERLVRVLPDVSGLSKEFDYIVPARWADQVDVGTMVRIDLHGRRVAGWVVAVDLAPEPGMALRTVAKVSSVGPPAAIIDLARWAAHRWSGRLTPILKTASPPTMVRGVPRARPPASGRPAPDPLAADALSAPATTVIQVGPADDQFRFVEAAAALGNALVVVPSVGRARWLGGRLGRVGVRSHIHPGAWAAGMTGGVVIGSRSSVWAPTAPLSSIVVLDEHDEALQEERVPTWHARDVAIERARLAGVPCLLVSPAPSLAGVAAADRRLQVARTEERNGWPVVEIIDRRNDEPGRPGLFSPRVAEVLRGATGAVAVLNRKGRAKMLACGSCGELVKSEDGEHLMVEVDGQLLSPRTGETRPMVCAVCTGTQLKRLRLGVTRAAEELAALVGEPVTEYSSDTAAGGAERSSRLYLGTEAVLHAGVEADTVVFLDFDQELHAPRYRAAEQAMWLLVRAARLLGGRRGRSAKADPSGKADRGGQSSQGGPGRRRQPPRIVIQTRSPDHRVLRAAVAADPGRMWSEERALRSALGFPPAGALAEIGGAGADALIDNLTADEANGLLLDAGSMRVLGPRRDGAYLVRADDPIQLADALARAPRPKPRVRISVDPPRV